jgi:hypothetical protein
MPERERERERVHGVGMNEGHFTLGHSCELIYEIGTCLLSMLSIRICWKPQREVHGIHGAFVYAMFVVTGDFCR